MIFQTEQELFNFIASHQKPCDWILKARKDAAELSALIDGCEFDSLITKIEGIESEDKMKARKKYSRSIEDYFERLLLPIANIFNSTGFTKKYNVNPDKLDTFLKTISNIRDGKSIQSYVQNQWMPVYHTDPNGIIFIEYTTIPELKVYPTYKNICNIRYYELKSQVLDVLLFEPCIEDDVIKWRVVDDKFDYTVYQKGESFVIDTENTFEHPFGEVPAFVNSDILFIIGVNISVS